MTSRLVTRVDEQRRLMVVLVGLLNRGAVDAAPIDPFAVRVLDTMFDGIDDLRRLVDEVRDEPTHAALPSAAERRADYLALVERIRQRTAALVPPASCVAVVTRGDPALTDLPGATGWHYPSDELGNWAGFHPADGADAVERLLQLVRRGADHVLIPATGRWWLQHYRELHAFLDGRHTCVVDDDDMVLYRLVAAPVDRPASTIEAHRYRVQADRFAELTAALLPPSAHVAVVSRGDDVWLRSTAARHFPADEQGTYMGHPANDSEAMRWLDVATQTGAEFFAIPSALDWWTDAYPRFTRELHRVHRCIADQPGVGVLFALESMEETP